MIVWIALLLQIVSSPVFAGEGGGGVKNGGSALECPENRAAPIMLELAEAYTGGADVQETEDRGQFFRQILDALHHVGTAEARQLGTLLMGAVTAHGPSDSWKATPFRVPTIIKEDEWHARQLDSVDWENGIVELKSGCRILPVSYLSPKVLNQPRPPIVTPYYKSLNRFNRLVLELHEALYDLYTMRNTKTINVLPTRALGRLLLDRKIVPARLADEVRRFMFVGYVFPSVALDPGHGPRPWVSGGPGTPDPLY